MYEQGAEKLILQYYEYLRLHRKYIKNSLYTAQ
jgi:hypothetical protein